MVLWYKHTGEPEVEKFPPSDCTLKKVGDMKEISSSIGEDYHVTHMWLAAGKMTSSFLTICHRLTHLRLYNKMADHSQLGM